jgi:hydroxymethylglutaryl-CoA reductase (NADPH)
MSTSSDNANRLIDLFAKIKPFEEILDGIALRDKATENSQQSIPGPFSWSSEAHQKRVAFIKEKTGVDLKYLIGSQIPPNPEVYKGNIENYIGNIMVPTGVVGPLLINGTAASGDFFVPLATTEGALVASYNRGAKATRLSGGITSVCLTEGVQRAPVFKFNMLSEIGTFIFWVLENLPLLKDIVAKHSNYCKLQDLRINMEGNNVIIVFEYTTGDAAGQNMVTICTEEICKYIIENTPIKPNKWYLESNYSGDKKATAVSFSSVRGKKVTTEAKLHRKIVKEVLGSTPEDIAIYWQTSAVCAVQSGSLGIQGHFANGLTALFMACGQDVACVAEAYVGITRMEVCKDGDLYISVTLPSLVVGTVGGGTHLPTQQECLKMIGCTGEGSARKFAEICGATVLAGELSIAAALASGSFSKAHKIFGRSK